MPLPLSLLRRARAATALALVAVAALLLTSCQVVPNTGPDGDAFYTPPTPLPAGSRGDVVWYHYTNLSLNYAYDAYQILYHSTDALGQANVVSGSVIVPTALWTGPGSRPIIALAPETQGMGDSCAPSKTLPSGGQPLLSDIGYVNAALAKGWAVAMTDYEGLGTPGNHTYIVGPAMGHAVLDSVRAAQRLPFLGLKADAPIGIWGYSEGGAGAAWAGELAPTYAPELQLKGVAAGGVPADLPAVAANLDGGFGFGFLAAAAVGFDTAYPELNLENYLNDQGRADFASSKDKCTVDLVFAMAGKTIAGETTSNPLNRPEWQARLAQSKLGNTKPPVPQFLYHGVADEFIPYAVGTGLKDRYCAKGVKVKWVDYAGEHLITGGAAQADGIAFFADRFNGVAPTSSC